MSSQLRNFMLSNVRCFEGQHNFNIRPLTLLVGENNTGKSTVLGCMQVIGDYLSSGSFEKRLDFNCAPYEMGSFNDIARKRNSGTSESDTFELGFEFSAENGEDFKLLFQMHERENGSEPVMNTIRLVFEDGEIHWKVVLIQKFEPPDSVEINISVKNNRRIFEIKVPVYTIPSLDIFLGNLTWDDTSAGLRGFTQAKEYIETVLSRFVIEDKMEYLHDERSLRTRLFPKNQPFTFNSFAPIRSNRKRTYDPVEEDEDSEGNNTPALLVNMYRSDHGRWKKIKKRLEDFGKRSGLFDEIDVRDFSKAVSDPFQLQFKNHEGQMVNLIDIGYGVSQILPILVRVFDSWGTKFLMQQPELSLHPRAQAELISLLIALYKGYSHSYVVETHSDAVINRARIEIMQGKIPPEDVSLIYLESGKNGVVVHNIEFDEQANMIDVPVSYREFFMIESDRLLGINLNSSSTENLASKAMN